VEDRNSDLDPDEIPDEATVRRPVAALNVENR
jgi:hypothetical protein